MLHLLRIRRGHAPWVEKGVEVLGETGFFSFKEMPLLLVVSLVELCDDHGIIMEMRDWFDEAATSKINVLIHLIVHTNKL